MTFSRSSPIKPRNYITTPRVNYIVTYFHPERQEFESKWRPKCKEEEVKTPQLYERNRQLRLELQMLYKQADTIISHAQGTLFTFVERIYLNYIFAFSIFSFLFIISLSAISVVFLSGVLVKVLAFLARYPPFFSNEAN